MFYHLFSKTYRAPFIVLLIFGILLYNIDTVCASIISSNVGIDFRYEEKAHLKLIYLLLGVVVIALTSAINQNKKAEPKAIRRAFLNWFLLCIGAFVIGNTFHVFSVINILKAKKSMIALETSWIYFMADFALVLAFSIGGFGFVKPLVNR